MLQWKNKQHLNIYQDFDPQMSLSKSKFWYSNNCLHFLKCAVPQKSTSLCNSEIRIQMASLNRYLEYFQIKQRLKLQLFVMTFTANKTCVNKIEHLSSSPKQYIKCRNSLGSFPVLLANIRLGYYTRMEQTLQLYSKENQCVINLKLFCSSLTQIKYAIVLVLLSSSA